MLKADEIELLTIGGTDLEHRFGCCPERCADGSRCGRNDGYMIRDDGERAIRRCRDHGKHVGVCFTHKVYWLLGTNQLADECASGLARRLNRDDCRCPHVVEDDPGVQFLKGLLGEAGARALLGRGPARDTGTTLAMQESKGGRS